MFYHVYACAELLWHSDGLDTKLGRENVHHVNGFVEHIGGIHVELEILAWPECLLEFDEVPNHPFPTQ